MRKFLFVGITFAALLHFMLHIFVQKKTISTLPTNAVKEFKTCYNEKFQLILNMSEIDPFLCQDFRKQSVKLGSNKLDLPYGTRRGDRFFDLALKNLPQCKLPEEIKNISCKKCVVVGNGGVLRNSSLGKTIDSYDIIIRMNDGPVLGYEADVGQKTTFRLCYPESMFSETLHYDPNTTVVLLMFKPHDVKWLSELLMHKRVSTYGFWRKPALSLIYKPHQLRVLNPFILRQVSQNILNFPINIPKTEKSRHPTTGIIAITLAFSICNEVHIAGFKYNLTSLNSSLHYYGNETMSAMAQNEYHNISAEQMIIRDLVKQKTIKNLT
ncbi:type 2 lactosamine alpha-2,3-sialyltransferase isoform X2 [Xenopus laevis]|nr:type 2 lactosamine alpha-2,3-sialyltransferase isoform X2 [Xenopus laevis]XP_018104328.1 type 2 lactosamine alpha-2,3-sialyltransferase isoform X2 [Xenopus laevis]XP_041439286.1 type 2 lactosamine alpha-2,3-sialyltransferase isoform X2 [Xenopus laevis]